MKRLLHLFFLFLITQSLLFSSEFTISSYNCGGLSNHYDYLRAVAMQKLMQERFNTEPEVMSQNEEIQKLALKILFSSQAAPAQKEWEEKNYSYILHYLTGSSIEDSIHAIWRQKSQEMITSYKVRPALIMDEEVQQSLENHVKDLALDKEASWEDQIKQARAVMAKRIFHYHMKYDILCLQEADYLEPGMFPSNLGLILSHSTHSKNGVAWNKERFELVENVGDVLGRAYVIKLLEKETRKTILVASCHITGCNPYRLEDTDGKDSAKGDAELQAVVDILEEKNADFMIIGMDSNVTSLHPRLNIIKNANYRLDFENFFEATCSNPNLILNTRIDWIALKAPHEQVTITNIPVLGVGLNSLQSNISDHKPVAAKIKF
ncbi:MAG: hypothetical protein BGO14_08380 [Chlamydiales bacterium 38-26]|nr:endonuclease/exonuclease/phosphatase family protein [Chlamydiales bacterium]OJV11006.1 MAG: hypothetical protein BGO14_08380 [Chlamydiales bacterium 38-26]